MKKYLLLLGLSTFAFNAYAGCEKGELNCWDCSKAGDATSSCTARLKDSTLTVSGTGNMADYDYYKAPWFGNRNAINTVVVEEGITHIGSTAFIALGNLTEVKLPEGLETIGGQAFRGTNSLSSLEIPSSTVLGGWSLSSMKPDLEVVLNPKESVVFADSVFQNCCSGNDNMHIKVSCKGEMSLCEQMMQKAVPYITKSGSSFSFDYYKTKDKNGNVIEEWGPNGKNTYKYDSGGNVVAKFGPNGERLYGKKIYTVEEAEAATAKGEKFHVSLTYK